MAKVIITKIDWLFEDVNEKWPQKTVEISLPWDELEKIAGIQGENVLIDIFYLEKEIDNFKATLQQIKKTNDRLHGKDLYGL